MEMDNNIKSKNQILEYSSEKYRLKVEYDKSKNNFIELFVEKESIIDSYFYNIKMNFSEFIESRKLFRLCDNLEEVFNLISKLIDENLVSIEEIINDNQLILLLKMFVSGSEEPLTAKIKLLKKKFDQNELINKLYEQIGTIEKLSERIDKLEKECKRQQKIKILQIYPRVEAANQLRQWMEIEGYGKGIVDVNSVCLTNFNKEPYEWLKLGDKWNYDIILFGIWDSNSGIPLKDEAVNAITAFINDGGGCILTHDTIGLTYGKSGFNKLREMFRIKVGKWGESPFGDYDNQWGYFSTKIKITKTGSLTTYPWKIGEINKVFPVLLTHTTSNAVYKDNVWIELCEGDYKCGKEPNALKEANYIDNFYLSIKNKCAMIQVGHSNNANADEKKIIANLIFYLFNLKN
ncbi:hypothetical protein BCR32DRAFT_246562 [Anaeromyces robustus]|uniref:ThuA-like domain-containing protein n=1 Tax=Anaeromyces robustus TaxID=1754192 RepID=A0A1Y1X1L6_9FUNG|nr:hypothetical protein BCR32DRAFT_246562 [Anaeromyces robustus]|eukprot:ORX79224.1 hypothetical protein BCR32DRAFT_246562 [Anaeromyces robustus]